MLLCPNIVLKKFPETFRELLLFNWLIYSGGIFLKVCVVQRSGKFRKTLELWLKNVGQSENKKCAKYHL
jgi:hypothetical protein